MRPIAGRTYENLDTKNRVRVVKVDTAGQRVTIAPVRDPAKTKTMAFERFEEFFRIYG